MMLLARSWVLGTSPGVACPRPFDVSTDLERECFGGQAPAPAPGKDPLDSAPRVRANNASQGPPCPLPPPPPPPPPHPTPPNRTQGSGGQESARDSNVTVHLRGVLFGYDFLAAILPGSHWLQSRHGTDQGGALPPTCCSTIGSPAPPPGPAPPRPPRAPSSLPPPRTPAAAPRPSAVACPRHSPGAEPPMGEPTQSHGRQVFRSCL